MMKFLAAAALATAIASPAFAQTAVRPAPSQFNLYNQNGGDGQRRAVNPGTDVYQNGQYLGSDPDPNVRLQLRRDSEIRDPN